jgi:cell division protein FtsB
MDPKKKLLIGAGIGLGLLALYGPAFLRWSELNARQEQLETEIAALKKENVRLYQEAKRLREDPSYAEAVARRQSGFVRPGETVVKFQRSSKETQKR